MMSKTSFPEWRKISVIVFDFDGVFTDNKVYVTASGEESVCCDRRDGLGIAYLKNFKEINKWDCEFLILSTEKNEVVEQRAKKLRINCIYGSENKLRYLNSRFGETLKESMVYIGNDLNDLDVMRNVFFSVAPQDAHPKILEIADHVLASKGGDGAVREMVEILIEMSSLDAKILGSS